MSQNGYWLNVCGAKISSSNHYLETLSVVQPESGCLSLADVITIADDVSRVTSRITDNGREVLDSVLARMEEQANEQGRVAIDAYRVARRGLEAEWVTAESVVDDTVNECNRSIHSFVTQADFLIRRFENELHRKTRNRVTKPAQKSGKQDSGDAKPEEEKG